jgi:hypothetical protein
MKQTCSTGFSCALDALRARWLPAIAPCTAIALAWAGIATPGAAEATARMEQLAGRIEHAGVLHPDTVQQLEQVLHTPQYECGRVHCRPELEARNQAARARLEKAIARIYPGQIVAASRPHD